MFTSCNFLQVANVSLLPQTLHCGNKNFNNWREQKMYHKGVATRMCETLFQFPPRLRWWTVAKVDRLLHGTTSKVCAWRVELTSKGDRRVETWSNTTVERIVKETRKGQPVTIRHGRERAKFTIFCPSVVSKY